MKKSSSLSLLPFEAEDVLSSLAQRVVLTRRTLGLTQADLAAKAGVGLSTIVAIEKGAPTVQLGASGKRHEPAFKARLGVVARSSAAHCVW